MSDSFAASNAFVTVRKDAKEANLMCIIFEERAAFDLLNLPLTDHGPKPHGHVLSKNIEHDNQYIVFQYWVARP